MLSVHRGNHRLRANECPSLPDCGPPRSLGVDRSFCSFYLDCSKINELQNNFEQNSCGSTKQRLSTTPGAYSRSASASASEWKPTVLSTGMHGSALRPTTP